MFGEHRKKLPCYNYRSEFLEKVRSNQVLVVVGETGSGKTTQLPQYLLEAGLDTDGIVACTQPRRVAAISVASRVSEEVGAPLGATVGYTIRFEDKTSRSTRLNYMTDGMLLRQATLDHDLKKYGIIILDEAHERTMATDILLGVLKQLLTRRSDLKLIVMSATLDHDVFMKYFEGNCSFLSIPGRLFSVSVMYTAKPVENYVDAAVKTVVDIHTKEPPGSGDVLVFLTGEDEIENVCDKLRLLGNTAPAIYGTLAVIPLYASLTIQQQQAIFEPAPPPILPGGPKSRKVIVSTNIAETSVTIDGIVYVVDPGFSKQKVYNPRTRVESLLVAPISRASAKQRSGRAGRTREGKCYRLYTEDDFSKLRPATYPEILLSNLSSVVLQLKKLGVEDLVHFDFIEPPSPEAMMRALENLHYLGALDDEANLTELGGFIAEYPLDPQLAVCLVAACKFGVAADVLAITALLSSGQVFQRPRSNKAEADSCKSSFKDSSGEHMRLLHVFDEYSNAQRLHREDPSDNPSVHQWCKQHFINHRTMQGAVSVREQLSQINRRLGLSTDNTEEVSEGERSRRVRKSFLSGFFQQVCIQVPNKQQIFKTIDHQVVQIHPSDDLSGNPRWVMYNEFVLTSRNFIRTVSSVDGEWLLSVAPRFCKDYSEADGDFGKAIKELYSQNQAALMLNGKRKRNEA